MADRDRTTQLDEFAEYSTLVLQVISGGDAVVPLVPGSLILGRGSEADVSLSSPTTSRRHARLIVDDDGASLEDLGSATGTWLGERRLAVGERVRLQPTAMIRLGSAWLALAPARPQRIVDVEPAALAGLTELHQGEAQRLGMELARLRMHFAQDTPLDVARTWLGSAVSGTAWLARLDAASFEAVLPLTTSAQIAQLMDRARAWPPGGRGGPRLHAVMYPRPPNDDASGAVVCDPVVQAIYDEARALAAGDISVLVLGETGAGKERLAHAIHAASPRRARPLVRLNCASLTESLLEAELFGHERGAFTGATAARAGLLEQAHGGTLFLDEVGELSLAAQAKLLRALEDGVVRRVGATAERPIDVRFVSATNRELRAEVQAGRFRQDLYYRVAMATLVLPPLRQRPSEIEALTRRFLAVAAKRVGRPELALGAEALALLRAYAWPGNVRELRAVIERAVLLARSPTLLPELLPRELQRGAPAPSRPSGAGDPPGPGDPGDAAAAAALASVDGGGRRPDRERLREVLDQVGGNQSKAAELLGVSRRTLANWMIALGLPRPRR